MNYFNAPKIYKVKLTRDLSKHIKRGNPWVFADALEKLDAPEGSYALLVSHKNEVLAHGLYSPAINLAFRVIQVGDRKIKNQDIEKRLTRALEWRRHLLHAQNTSFRLINGEGDELPGVVADYYQGVLVLKLDGEAAENFWNKQALGQFFMNQKIFPLHCVYYKRKNREENKGMILASLPEISLDLSQWEFCENGVKFRSHLIDGAKTGFFLDQRDHRQFIREVAGNRTLLNLFGYTGGFSVYAGLGGASEVTTVDMAKEAILASSVNWQLNDLAPEKHEALCEDAFEFVLRAQAQKKSWDIVITDPPSFAPNQKSRQRAQEAYMKIFADSIKLVRDEGFFAASSCSGHICFEDFLLILQEALSKARCRGKILKISGQPEDHPFPMALSEMRYLKFVYLQIFKD